MQTLRTLLAHALLQRDWAHAVGDAALLARHEATIARTRARLAVLAETEAAALA